MTHVPQSPDGLDCSNCPDGTYEEGRVTRAFERGETVVVVRKVPAHVCDTCGDSLVGQAELTHLHSIVESAEKLDADSLVCEYGEEEAPTGKNGHTVG